MENMNKEKPLETEELEKVNGGLIQHTLTKYHCLDCSADIHQLKNNACLYCGSKNIMQRW